MNVRPTLADRELRATPACAMNTSSQLAHAASNATVHNARSMASVLVAAHGCVLQHDIMHLDTCCAMSWNTVF